MYKIQLWAQSEKKRWKKKKKKKKKTAAPLFSIASFSWDKTKLFLVLSVYL